MAEKRRKRSPEHEVRDENSTREAPLDADLEAWIGQALEGLPGVGEVRVLVGEDDQLDGILIRAGSTDAATKARARLLEALPSGPLSEMRPAQVFVSIATDRSSEVMEPICVSGVDVMLEGDCARVRVKVSRGRERGVGIEAGTATRYGVLRQVCLATLAALESMGAHQGGWTVESLDSEVVATGYGRRTVVQVVLSGPDEGEYRVGAAMKEKTGPEAAAWATVGAFSALRSS